MFRLKATASLTAQAEPIRDPAVLLKNLNAASDQVLPSLVSGQGRQTLWGAPESDQGPSRRLGHAFCLQKDDMMVVWVVTALDPALFLDNVWLDSLV